MTRRRWIADEVSANQAALTGAHADHLIRALRARVGQEFDIAAGTAIRRGRVVRVADGRIEFELGDEVPVLAPADVTLLQAIFKFDRMEWAIEKCTELGVRKIVPVIARRTDTHLAAASAKRAERWRRIALQASEQSRRSSPPEIADAVKLHDSLSLRGAVRVVLSESEQQMQLRDVFTTETSGEILLAIGPEGGWTEDELQLFHESGWISASLGP
ncbi:MAG: RsmE family RNA methyltransferase, partial [Candidatus Sulfotelmatobacter sp.]